MAVRSGDWKLVSYVAKMDEGELLRTDPRDQMTPHRLYNLNRDIGESEDLAQREPERGCRTPVAVESMERRDASGACGRRVNSLTERRHLLIGAQVGRRPAR